MVWFKPRTWFKNTPNIVDGNDYPNSSSGGIESLSGSVLPLSGTEITGDNASAISMLDNQLKELSSNTSTLGEGFGSGGINNLPTSTGTVFDGLNTGKTKEESTQFKLGGNLIKDIRNIRRLNEMNSLEEISNINQSNASQLDISLDPFINEQELGQVSDNPVDSTVTTRKEESDTKKSFWDNYIDAKASYIQRRTEEGKGQNYITGPWKTLWNAAERSRGVFGDMSVGLDADRKYGGDFSIGVGENMGFSDSNPSYVSRYHYLGPNQAGLSKDIYETIPNAIYRVNMGEMSYNEYEDLIDQIYNKYKDGFELMDGRFTSSQELTKKVYPFSKELFMKMVNNQYAKNEYINEENEKRGINSDYDTSVVSQARAYGFSVIGPKIKNSNMNPEAAQEVLNDFNVGLTEFAGRLYNEMSGMLNVKNDIEKELGINNLLDLSYDEVPDEYKEFYTDIKKERDDYNQFIKNYVGYNSLLIDLVNPETGKIDEIPDYVIDGNKSYTFREALYNGIELRDKDTWFYGGKYMSPLEVMKKQSIEIVNNWSNQTDGFWGRLWTDVQYFGANYIGAPVSELGQFVFGGLGGGIRNIIVSDSQEVPYIFKDMDSSITASMTTNKSNFARLRQSYAIKIGEYTPELIGNIIEAIAADKGATKIGQIGQVRLLSYLNNSRRFNQSIRGRQAAQAISYTLTRGAPRLLIDQALIDAPLSIGDSERGSDTSMAWSLRGTALGEGIGIILDNSALLNSFMRNFTKNSNNIQAMYDPLRLIYENPGMLNDVAASFGRGIKDESGRLVGDANMLLIQDLSEYAKNLSAISDEITDATRRILAEGGNIDNLNEAVKKGAYVVLKQVFAQNSAMSKIITDLVTDNRANIADMVKYIGDINGTLKIGPWVSTIKVDRGGKLSQNVVKSYDERMDFLIDGGLAAGLNRGLTRGEIESLAREGFLPKPETLGEWNKVDFMEGYFVPYKDPSNPKIERIDGNTSKIVDGTRYYATQRGLDWLKVNTSSIDNPLAIAAMTEDTKSLINKLKQLPQNKRKLTDLDLDNLGETNTINILAESIANIKYLDICK